MHNFGELLIFIGIFGMMRQLLLFGSALTIAEFWPDDKKDVYIQGGMLLISVALILAGLVLRG